MNVENAGGEKEERHHCWLTADEQSELENHVKAEWEMRDRLIISLGINSGLRSFEIPQIRPMDLSRETTDDGDVVPFVRVPRGKDTKDGRGKERETICPDISLFEAVADAQGLDDDEPFVDVSARWVQQIISDVTDSLADETGNENWEKVSSHDLRRSWGHDLLVRENVNGRILMSMGGWNDYETMDSYLTRTTVDEAAEEMAEVLSE